MVTENRTGTFVKLVPVTGFQKRRVIVSLALTKVEGVCSLIWSAVGWVTISLMLPFELLIPSVSESWYSPEDWQCTDDLQTPNDPKEQHEKVTGAHYNGWYEGSRSDWSDSAL